MLESITRRGSEPAFWSSIGRVLACPTCHAALQPVEATALRCSVCLAQYPVVGSIPDLRPATATQQAEVDWSAHWSDERQRNPVQRFFSFYRKAVFARSVRYFTETYFAKTGVFVEAGSGTAETSMRIEKRDGQRVLVAVDIVLPVLQRVYPNMDVALCGDIFRLPFADASIDGLWNVGVMEHLTQPEIDQALQEYRRVLRPGGRLLMLWPATDSIPQKLLGVVEKIVNLKKRPVRFRFHPEEISRLRGARQGQQILSRNGFETTYIDFGLRTLMAFKTVVGTRP